MEHERMQGQSHRDKESSTTNQRVCLKTEGTQHFSSSCLVCWPVGLWTREAFIYPLSSGLKHCIDLAALPHHTHKHTGVYVHTRRHRKKTGMGWGW